MGILVGRGTAEYRNVRYLERNWRLPFRRIKRDLSRSFSAAERIERAAPGRASYRGERPPPLIIRTWRPVTPNPTGPVDVARKERTSGDQRG